MKLSRHAFLRLSAGALIRPALAASGPFLLDPESIGPHVARFNAMAPEEVVNLIPDAKAFEWIKANVPLFTCPDPDVEEIYYFRWWTYRKHIRQTPLGFIVTEFLKPVPHAGEFNSLSCALGHHIAEGRWLHEPQYIEQDIQFWLLTGPGGAIRPSLHQFSGWTAAALYDKWLADGNRNLLVSYLNALILDFQLWDRERLTPAGLYWQYDVSDGMESSISGGRAVRNIRPSINAYMYGNAQAISAIAALSGKTAVAADYSAKAARLQDLTQRLLWNKSASFFETLDESGKFVPVRENIGYTPWYFNLPQAQGGYEIAWKQLVDPQGFYAPYGPTTAERRHPDFRVLYQGDDCQWNGPSWPFATTITLRALANVLNGERQSAVTREDYWRILQIYTRSQHRKLDDGRTIPWIDENLNPLTGEWLARAIKLRKKTFYGRGDYYNHSAYADLIITGLAGLRPRPDDALEVNPLAPADWDWWCLDHLPYHGRLLTILWDRAGTKFHKGKGLRVFADGVEIASSPALARISKPKM